jgi:DNA-binding transcriptional LysR family regulator
MDWGSAFARFHARSFGEAVLPVLRTNIGESARAFVTSNGGAAYLPASIVENSRPRLYAVPKAPEYSRKLCAAYRGNSDKLSLIESVLDVFDGLQA